MGRNANSPEGTVSGDWGEVSAGKVFVMQARGPEFKPQSPCKDAGVVTPAGNANA